MDTYIYYEDGDSFDTLSLADAEEWSLLDRFDGRPVGAAWKPVRVVTHRKRRRGSFPYLASHIPVFDRRALDVLRGLLGDSVEVLPLDSRAGELYALNVLDVVDCLDPARARVERDSSGLVMFIDTYAFRPGCLQGKHMFKVREAELKEVLVSERFKQVVDEHQLKGLKLKPVA